MLTFRTLAADEIECRVAQCKATGVQLLLYKDARCDMNILDETVGAMNWKREHSRDNANCTVSIWDAEKSQWISKEDTGTESNTEAEKGLASDSFKRACVNFGIGRELYTSPFIWINGVSEQVNGRWVCRERFTVKEIGYDDKRRINALTVVNSKGAEVFKMGAPVRKPVERKPKEHPEATPVICEFCGKQIEPYEGANGGTVPVLKHVLASKKKFGHVLCLECIADWPNRPKEEAVG